MRLFTFISLLITATLVTKAQSYRVGPGDLLKISEVSLKEELDDEYRIDTLGYLKLPFIGRLDVRDKTVVELQTLITDALKEGTVNDPQVFIDIIEYNYRPVSVIGAVQQPGKLKRVGENIDLIGALTQSGGILETASDKIMVIRKTPQGLNETLEISYRKLMVEGLYYLNIPLYPGDTVNVPLERPLVVSVLGEVKSPGEFKFNRDSKVTILRVLASAGGFTDYAKRSKVIVQREVDGKTEEITLNIKAIQRGKSSNFEMNHNDVVFVQ